MLVVKPVDLDLKAGFQHATPLLATQLLTRKIN
jgi:hypothetical protein